MTINEQILSALHRALESAGLNPYWDYRTLPVPYKAEYRAAVFQVIEQYRLFGVERIAEALSMPVTTIRNWQHKGARGNYCGPSRREIKIMRMMHERGSSVTAIANRFKFEPAVVYYWTTGEGAEKIKLLE